MAEVRGRLTLTTKDFNAALKHAGANAKKFNAELKRLSGTTANKLVRDQKRIERNSVRSTKKMKEGWWKKFGAIALGFTIAYRAMNAFEAGLSKTVSVIGEAIRESGVLAETQAKLAFWYQLHSEEAITFAEAFQRAAVNVEALRKASIRSISTLEELAIGIDEISQTIGGIGPQSIEAMASVVDFTVMVAQTTGSTTRQIRQELQALMDGRIKTTDQLARSLMKVGILTKQDLRDLREMRNQAEILDKVFRLLGERQKVVNEILLRSSVELALKFWEKSIRNVIILSIKLASELKGVDSLFAETMARHAEEFMKKFTEKDTDRFIILMNKLNWVLDKALSSFEEFVKFTGKLAVALDNISPKAIALGKAFGTLLILNMVVPLLKSLSSLVIGLAAKMFAIPTLILAIGLALVTIFKSWREEIEAIVDDIKFFLTDIGGKIVAVAKALGRQIGVYKDLEKDLTNIIYKPLFKQQEDLDYFKPTWDYFKDEFPKAFRENLRLAIGKMKGMTEPIISDLMEYIDELFTPKAIRPIGEGFLDPENPLNYLLGLGTPKRTLKIDEEQELKDVIKITKAAYKLYVKMLDVRRKADDKYYTQLHKYQEDVLTLYMSERDALIAVGKARNLAARDFELMIARFDLDEFTDRYERMRDGWQSAIESMTDYWMDFLRTGKFEFGNFITDVLAQIARLVIAEYLVMPIAKAIGRLMGGFFSLGAPVSQNAILSPMGGAKGGILSGPTYFPGSNVIGGEAGKEALLPLSRLPGGKLGVGVSGMFNVNIMNYSGEEIEQSEASNRQGGRDLNVVIGAAMGQDVASGGPLSRSIARTFNLRRGLTRRS